MTNCIMECCRRCALTLAHTCADARRRYCALSLLPLSESHTCTWVLACGDTLAIHVCVYVCVCACVCARARVCVCPCVRVMGGQKKLVRQVILSAGAIGSPHLLQLSGVGPKAVLDKIGVAPVAVLPGVGENLQDHLELLLQFRCLQPVSLYSSMNPLGKLLIGLRWLLLRDGLGATNHMEATGFIRSDKGIEYPDIQYHFVPLAISYGSCPQLF